MQISSLIKLLTTLLMSAPVPSINDNHWHTKHHWCLPLFLSALASPQQGQGWFRNEGGDKKRWEEQWQKMVSHACTSFLSAHSCLHTLSHACTCITHACSPAHSHTLHTLPHSCMPTTHACHLPYSPMFTLEHSPPVPTLTTTAATLSCSIYNCNAITTALFSDPLVVDHHRNCDGCNDLPLAHLPYQVSSFFLFLILPVLTIVTAQPPY